MTVERVRIGDVVKLARRPAAIDASNEYVFLGMSAGGGGFFKKPPTSGTKVRPGSAFLIKPGDFVYSRLFAWRGSFEIANVSEDACLVSGEFPTFEVDHSRLDPRWLRYWLMSEPGLREVHNRSAGSTPGSRNRLREDRFLDIPLPLLSIAEQHAIADQFDRLQASATDLAGRSRHASALMSALAVSASARPDLDSQAKARAGWRRVPLGQVARLDIRDVQVEHDKSYDVAGVYSFGRGLFRRAAVEGSTSSYKTLHRLRAGQLVMSRLKVWEGALALVPVELEGWCVSPEFPTFDIDSEQADARFIAAVVTAERFWGRLRGASHGIGARRERVSASRLLEQEIDLPSIDEQRSIAETIQRLQVAQMHRRRSDERTASLVPAALNKVFADLS